jgi:hypothetical protein
MHEGYPIIEHLFYDLPSERFPAYMGVDNELNEIKGMVSLINYSKLLSLN